MMDGHQHHLRMASTTIDPTLISEMRLLKNHETFPNSMWEILWDVVGEMMDVSLSRKMSAFPRFIAYKTTVSFFHIQCSACACRAEAGLKTTFATLAISRRVALAVCLLHLPKSPKSCSVSETVATNATRVRVAPVNHLVCSLPVGRYRFSSSFSRSLRVCVRWVILLLGYQQTQLSEAPDLQTKYWKNWTMHFVAPLDKSHRNMKKTKSS